MSNPSNLRYTPEHLWIKENGDTILVGITDYAQEQLGDILFVDLPEAGKSFEPGETFTEIESQKTASELSLPFGAEIVASNEALDDSPELINEDAYANWIAEIKVSGSLEGLLDAAAYEAAIEAL
jgi:glycine cleavage system H protein